MTPDEIRTLAARCQERQAEGLMIHPKTVPMIVEALRLLAASRENGSNPRKR